MDPAPDNPPTEHRWLRRFTYLVIAATFALIAIGGKVTSFEYGMAIPGGFTTGGWISFLAPLEYWFHDTDKFWEHTHRIKGTLVGFLTIAMTILLWRTQRDRPWLRWMGVIMLVLVCIQGAMGAFRVSEVSLTLAFVHGIAGQLILCSWIVVAAALSKPWLLRLTTIAKRQAAHPTVALRWSVRMLLLLLLVQLTLGSAVRHFKADKAIPDFPFVYGHVLPPMSQDSLDEAYIAYYAEQVGKAPDETTITNRSPQGEIVVALSDVDLQFAHRFGAVVVCLLGLYVIIAAIKRSGDRSIVIAPALIVLAMFSAQFALGVMTVLSETDPFMATLHQATGAALIAAATWLAVRIHLAEYAAVPAPVDETDNAPADLPANATPATA
jgi:cytochrome c oxidase assembly protein subunit 15